MNSDEWVRKNRNKYARDLIAKSGAISDDHPTAIFMAGLPGAGKTEFSKNLIGILGSKVVRLDMDEMATDIKGYRPEHADLFRKSASNLLSRVFDIVIDKELDFLMDGTFGGDQAVLNIERTIKHGYTIKVLYVYQDPRLAWDFTVKRERIEHRSIDQNGFIETYFKTAENLLCVVEKYNNEKITIDIVYKDNYNDVKEWIPNVGKKDIEKILKRFYNSSVLKDYING